ncbi:hypothetical protein DMUE_3249 [Dictyocoela muelleri]|nr:hypothetical protein DMUE_3249 [Dictyocoela muelleri]
MGPSLSGIITRWPSLLKAVFHYSVNLIYINEMVSIIVGNEIFINETRNILEDKNLFKDFFDIYDSYSNLVEILNYFEDRKYTIATGCFVLQILDFKQDLVELKAYITNRLKFNQIKDILDFYNINVSPVEYLTLRKYNPTSIAVEISFSMLG